MEKKRAYKLIILGLVALNIMIIVTFLVIKPPPPRKPPHGNIQAQIIDILHLNDEQIQNFEELAHAHKQKTRQIDEQQAKLLSAYFETLVDASTSIDNDTILYQFQQAERKK